MRISKTNHLRRLLQTQDVLLSTLAYVITVDACWLFGLETFECAVRHLKLTPLVLLISIAAALLDPPGLHGQRLRATLIYSVRYSVTVLAGLLMIVYLAGLDFTSRTVLGGFFVLLLVGLAVNRAILRWWYFEGRREHPSNYLKVLIIGTGARARKLIETYQENSEWGVSVVGMLDPVADVASREEIDGLPVLGDVSAIRRVLTTQVVDEVVVCLPRSLIDGIEEVFEACEEQAVCIKFMADVYDIRTATVQLETVGSLPVLTFEPVAHDEGKLIIKRILDLIVTLPALLVLLPFFALIALAIRIDSRGPVFFTQERVGLNKRPFRMIKFRSMFQDAEARLAEIEHLNEASGPIFKMKNDPRVTRVGGFLRRTSIDELPQLINVLLGHMSLVGPRPMSMRDVSLFSLGVQRRRFSVRPGLACLREISGRSQLSFDRWLELDLKYIDEWTLWLDIKILFKLIPAVLKGDGAS